MDAKELKTRFEGAFGAEGGTGLRELFGELGKEADGGESSVLAVLGEYCAEPALLKEEAARKGFQAVQLFMGVHGIGAGVLPLLGLVASKEFGEYVTDNSWSVCELSRLFGALATAEDADVFEKAVAGMDMAPFVREQVFMALVFRWIAMRETDADFLARIRRLMDTLPEMYSSPELVMALIVNAVAVGGGAVREQVISFYKTNADKAKEILSMASVRGFFDLGRPRLKSMLAENYMGMYGDEEAEITRMETFVAEDRPVAEQPKASKTIVRETPKVHRNDPCPCGSGKKYKKCCGKEL